MSKTSGDTVIYTAIFASHGETRIDPATQEQSAPADQDSGRGVSKGLLVLPLTVLLGGAGFGGWKLTRYMKDKKRGYVK